MASNWERPWMQYMSDVATAVAYSAAGALVKHRPSWFLGSSVAAHVVSAVLYVMALVGCFAATTGLSDSFPRFRDLTTRKQRAVIIVLIISFSFGGSAAILVTQLVPVDGEKNGALDAAQVHQNASPQQDVRTRPSPWPTWIGPPASAASK